MYAAEINDGDCGVRRRRRYRGVVGVSRSDRALSEVSRVEEPEGNGIAASGVRDSDVMVMGRAKRVLSLVKDLKAA